MGQSRLLAAIYCRLSTNDQSCERRQRDLRAFARPAGDQLAGVFTETASGARLDRTDAPPRRGWRCATCIPPSVGLAVETIAPG